MSKFSIKGFLPRSLFGRSLLILVLPVLLIQIVTTYVFFDRHWSKVTLRLANGVAGEIAVASDLLELSGRDRLDNLLNAYDLNLDFSVVFYRDKLLGDIAPYNQASLGWESMVADTLSHELRDVLGRPFTLDMDFPNKWVNVYVQTTQGVLYFGLPQRRLFSSSGYIFLLWMLGTSILLLVVATLFMRNQIRPIRKLAAAARRFGRGLDVSYFRPSGASEVRQAAESFLQMHKQITRSVEQRTTMLAGISHDLKTPLTRLKLELSMLEGKVDVSAMQSDIVEMEKMIAGYLDFVRGLGDEPADATNLYDLIYKVADDAKRQGGNVQIPNDLPALSYVLRPMAFERCLVNLVGNAMRYADHVWVNMSADDDTIMISVEDDGPGVDEDQYEAILRPFYRGDAARAQKDIGEGHVGLGLPIAVDIVHAHGGKMDLDRSAHGGLAIHITLYR